MNSEVRIIRMHSKQEWKELIRQGEESGKSRQEFCIEQGLSAEAYRRWLRYFAKKSVAEAKSKPRSKFAEIKSPVSFSTSVPISFSTMGDLFTREITYELELGKVKLRIPENFSEVTLMRVLTVLGRA